MKEHWQNSLEFFQELAGIFGWGICLVVAARLVFGASKTVAFGWFFAGLAIVAITHLVNGTELFAVPDPRQDRSTMRWLGHFAPLPSDRPTLESSANGILAIPIIVTVVCGCYLAIRWAMLSPETDAEQDNPEQ